MALMPGGTSPKRRDFPITVSASPPITYINRDTGRDETEEIFGEGALRWVYETALGRLSLAALVRRAWFSAIYGWHADRSASAAKVAPFIARYRLDTAEFADAPDAYATFNDFFYRKLKPGARPIAPGDATVVLPADGRHIGFQDASETPVVYAKGQAFDLAALLGDAALAEKYRHGAMVCSRLCPVDYHRFHFPAAGVPSTSRLINGFLYSVNPIALRRNLAYLWENKRRIVTVRTEHCGEVLLIPVGATNVGGIVDTYAPGVAVAKGDEMGHFRFGGSFIITLFEPGKVRLAEDLVAATKSGKELYARMGTPLGEAIAR